MSGPDLEQLMQRAQEMQQKLRDEEKAQKNRNSGVCFVTFKSLQLSMRLG